MALPDRESDMGGGMSRWATGGALSPHLDRGNQVKGGDHPVQMSEPSYGDEVPGGVACRICGTDFWGEPAIAHGEFFSHDCGRS